MVKLIDQETKGVHCSICKSWLHKICSNVTDEKYTKVTSSPEPFYCHICISESLPTNLWAYEMKVLVKSHLQKLSLITRRLLFGDNYHDLNSFNSIVANRKPDDICILHINIRSLRKTIDELSNMLSIMQKPPHTVAVS